MELRFHQYQDSSDAYWRDGAACWVDGAAWGAVRVNGEWLLDAQGNRRRFKTKDGATKAAKQFAAKQPQTV